MALQAGARIGVYEVTGVLGAGGMGEVYRARDPRLNRDVALKILPGAFALDPDRLARFRREAQVLASLNHPHVAHLYGLEDAGGAPALVMELAEGATLAELVGASAGLPLEQSLAIARQLTDALDAAHALGIVHRDLKPANIKVRDDGTVKVLDFGLAKALEPDGAAADAANSPTFTSPALTRPAVILGTAAYMAPEQARGRPVDRRADIWAFGCVLYEMLTGRQTFQAETVSDTIAAILTRSPDWRLLPDTTPPAVRRLLRRCLEKDPRQRLRDIGDAWHEVIEPSDAEPSPHPAAPGHGWRVSRSAMVAAAGASTLVAALAAAAGWSLARRSAPAATGEVRQFDVAAPGLKRSDVSVALSPDGRKLAYLAGAYEGSQIYVHSLEDGSEKPLAGTLAASGLFFSPDGRWIAFTFRDELKKVPVEGGPVVTLCSACAGPGGSWAPDGMIYLGSGTKGLSRVPAGGGSVEPVTTLDGGHDERGHAWPQLLPGGQEILFTVLTSTSGASRVAIESLGKKNRRVLVESGAFGRYLPTGHLVYARSGTLLAAPFDLRRSAVTGQAVPVVEGVAMIANSGGAIVAASDDGTLAVVRAAAQNRRTLAWVNRQGTATQIRTEPREFWHVSLSPDGNRLLTAEFGSRRVIWLHELVTGAFSPITFDGFSEFPEWSADGTKIVYVQRGDSTTDVGLRWQSSDGSHPPERLFANGRQLYPGSLARDGRTLIAMEINSSTGGDISVVDLGKEPKSTTPIVNTPATEWGGRLSPDEHWLAYISNESGRWDVYVQPYPGPGTRRRVSVDGGVEVVWARSGRELFYRNGSRMMAVPITTVPQLSIGAPQIVFDGPYLLGSPGGHAYDVSPDGQRFLMIQPSDDEIAASSSIRIRLNWFDQLKTRAPRD